MLLVISNERALTAFLVLAEFGCVTVLGFLLVQFMHWETRLNQKSSAWLFTVGGYTRRLRALRRQLDKLGGEWPAIPMAPSFQGKWKLIRWIFKAVSAVKWARS
jgi:hypothetical protein